MDNWSNFWHPELLFVYYYSTILHVIPIVKVCLALLESSNILSQENRLQ